jgi:hypothetical protein
MVPMPYILVNIVLDTFSLILFCTTSVALLSRSRLVSLWLPAQLRQRKTLTLIVTQGLVAGSSVMLAYQFLDKRCFLSMPKVRRRLLIALCSAAMTCVPLIAAVTAVVGLFIIK